MKTVLALAVMSWLMISWLNWSGLAASERADKSTRTDLMRLVGVARLVVVELLIYDIAADVMMMPAIRLLPRAVLVWKS